jgi:hypothetical protein
MMIHSVDFSPDRERADILAGRGDDSGNSWAGMARWRASPVLLWDVGYQDNSVNVTPAAHTRISSSPRPGRGWGNSSSIKDGG